MREGGVCPKCGSQNVLTGAELSDHVNPSLRTQASVRTFGKPEALIFKGARDSHVSADVCIDCGFIELYAVQPRKLAGDSL